MPELRIVNDPGFRTSSLCAEGTGYQWRMNGLMLEWRYKGVYFLGRWHSIRATNFFEKTPERRALWRDLFIHPV